MRIRILGTNHRTAPVALREKLALSEGEIEAALARLLAMSGVREVAVLSTCNRVEVVYVESGACTDAVKLELARWADLPLERLEPHLVPFVDEAAVQHLFRVCSSLDSMVLGESQINGQVKEAYRLASEQETVGPILHRLFHKAFGVAKRVRTETRVGASTLSVARAAADMASQVFSDLSRHPVLLLGAGEMAELALLAFKERGCSDLWVSNRTLARAAELAGPLDAAVLPWKRRAEFLDTADIVVASTAARQPVLTRSDVAEHLRARKGRPLFLIDISVPRNLDAAIHELESVYLFDIDDLGKVVELGQESRRREASQAEEIVEAEVRAFARILSQVHVSPLLRSMNQRTSRFARQEVERTLARLEPSLEGGLDRATLEEALSRMAQALGKRFLHDPIRAIKQLGEEGDIDRLADAAALLGVEATLLSVRDTEDAPELSSSETTRKQNKS